MEGVRTECNHGKCEEENFNEAEINNGSGVEQ